MQLLMMLKLLLLTVLTWQNSLQLLKDLTPCIKLNLTFPLWILLHSKNTVADSKYCFKFLPNQHP
jgi:hypothetical protein